MSVINVQCIDQTLTITNAPVIASGGILEDSVVFDFCNQWTGYLKKAVFWKSKDDTHYVDLDENDTCVIPKEVLAKDGTLYFGVFGVAGNVTRTSEVLKYQIVEGVMVSDESGAQDTPDPTPSVYARILASYQEVKNQCDNLEDDKADKLTTATPNNIAVFDEFGNLADGGKTVDEVTLNVPEMPAATDVDNADLIAINHATTIEGVTTNTLKKITFTNFVNAVKVAIGNFFAKTATYTAEVSSLGWSAVAPYTQTVTVTGILATDNPIPGVVFGDNATTNAAIKKAWGCVDRITTAADSVTFICFDKLPEVDFNVNLKVVR